VIGIIKGYFDEQGRQRRRYGCIEIVEEGGCHGSSDSDVRVDSVCLSDIVHCIVVLVSDLIHLACPTLFIVETTDLGSAAAVEPMGKQELGFLTIEIGSM
jgi:hypothetical protein